MNVKSLKEFLKDKPDDMPIGLLDLTTDDMHDANYPVTEKTLHIGDYVKFEDADEIAGL